jgi:hypothetical protein
MATTNSELVRRIKEAAKVMRIDEATLTSALAELGVGVEDDDATDIVETSLNADDARNSLLNKGVKPARFNAGWTILCGNEFPFHPKKEPTLSHPGNDSLVELIKSQRPASQWKSEELLAAYNEDCPEDVISELSRRAKDEPVIVFHEDGKVNADASLALLKQVRSGGKIPDMYISKNADGTQCVTKTCRVNEWPMKTIDECPLHGDVVLAGGFCEKCQANWQNVSNVNRQIVRVASNAGVAPEKPMAIISLIEEIENGGANPNPLLKVPSVMLAWAECIKDSDYPKLTRRLSRDKKNADPFFYHKKY